MTIYMPSKPSLPLPHQFKRKLAHNGVRHRTHFLIWLLAIICTVIAGIIVFIGYLMIHHRVPGQDIAMLAADLFEVTKNSSRDLNSCKNSPGQRSIRSKRP
ncbi:hypothetical protein K1719_001268 [Acacia pycnantha]|nr:hypothetical protein K1719_001268 [Acacia pycnantha]